MADFECRKSERGAYCRWCDDLIPKGQTMVSGYSSRNRGINMHFCLTCAKRIGELASEQT